MTQSFAGTYYPNLRDVLDPRFAGLSDAELEEAFETAFGEGVTPAEYEEFFSGLGNALGGVGRDIARFARKAAPVAATAAQGALQGAGAGSRLGPYGALGGALLGATGAALQRHGGGTARGVGSTLSGVVGTAGALSGGGLGGLLGRGGGQPSAIANLLGLLRRPEATAALGALARGRNPAIPVGRGATPVPANAFAGLLGALAREAEAEAESEPAGSIPAYLLNPAGQLVVDPSNEDLRAARLLQLMAGEAQFDDYDDAEYEDADHDEGGYEDAEFDDTEFDDLELDDSFDSFESFDDFEPFDGADVDDAFDDRYERAGR
jgi:hypothetical protein